MLLRFSWPKGDGECMCVRVCYALMYDSSVGGNSSHLRIQFSSHPLTNVHHTSRPQWWQHSWIHENWRHGGFIHIYTHMPHSRGLLCYVYIHSANLWTVKLSCIIWVCVCVCVCVSDQLIWLGPPEGPLELCLWVRVRERGPPLHSEGASTNLLKPVTWLLLFHSLKWHESHDTMLFYLSVFGRLLLFWK